MILAVWHPANVSNTSGMDGIILLTIFNVFIVSQKVINNIILLFFKLYFWTSRSFFQRSSQSSELFGYIKNISFPMVVVP